MVNIPPVVYYVSAPLLLWRIAGEVNVLFLIEWKHLLPGGGENAVDREKLHEIMVDWRVIYIYIYALNKDIGRSRKQRDKKRFDRKPKNSNRRPGILHHTLMTLLPIGLLVAMLYYIRGHPRQGWSLLPSCLLFYSWGRLFLALPVATVSISLHGCLFSVPYMTIKYCDRG